MSTYRFSFPTTIHFGPGVRAKVPAALLAEGKKRPLVVTDKGVAALPMLAELVAALRKEGLEPAVFSGVWGNPVGSQVQAGVTAFNAHHADSLVGLGGGAALDVAKAIGLLATHPGDIFDYEDDKPGARPFGKEIPYWVALPTTAGTGSEVGRSTVIADEQTHVKKIIFHPILLARQVFADPELTLALPPKITAATGMDALTHCVESYLAKGYHPICDGVALEGVRLAAQALTTCVRQPTNLEARGSMLMASMMGAIAFQKGLGLTHSCAHALGTVADMHHGLANGLMIDHALAFNLQAVPERFHTLAVTVGLRDSRPEAFVGWLSEQKAQVGIAAKLSAEGIREEQLERLAQLALEDSCHLNNPRPVTRADFDAIFRAAL
ncbi:MAG TPA: iron-containing alcohol dehydrogenase [Polyangiales bacterium]